MTTAERSTAEHLTGTPRRAMVVGASRGLGLELVRELLRRGWRVTATVRAAAPDLERLQRAGGDRLVIARLEMTSAEQVLALRERTDDHGFDLLFVNAAIDRGDHPITAVDTDTFVEVMITNALSPLRVVETFTDRLAPGATIAVMSSEQGSITRNIEPGYELYKASKAALNQLMRSHVTRAGEDGRTRLLIDPGHNRTALGGPDAPDAPEDSIPQVVDVLEAQAGAGGLQFLDRFGTVVPW